MAGAFSTSHRDSTNVYKGSVGLLECNNVRNHHSYVQTGAIYIKQVDQDPRVQP